MSILTMKWYSCAFARTVTPHLPHFRAYNAGIIYFFIHEGIRANYIRVQVIQKKHFTQTITTMPYNSNLIGTLMRCCNAKCDRDWHLPQVFLCLHCHGLRSNCGMIVLIFLNLFNHHT